MDKGNDQLALHPFLFQLVLIWAAMTDLLVFSAIVSSSPSLVAAAGAAADRLVMEFAVDHWTVWRTSLLHIFLFFGSCYRRPFFLRVFSIFDG
jgi:hypothetical protein